MPRMRFAVVSTMLVLIAAAPRSSAAELATTDSFAEVPALVSAPEPLVASVPTAGPTEFLDEVEVIGPVERKPFPATETTHRATVVVTTCANVGTGDDVSLAEAILQANAAGGNTYITFAAGLAACIISPTNLLRLPAVTGNNITIDGDVDGNGTPDIRITGSSSPGDGLVVIGTNCVLKGLSICCYSNAAIKLQGSYNTVTNCTLGASNGVGLEVNNGFSNTVGPGVIANQNLTMGLVIRGALAVANTVTNSQFAFNGNAGVAFVDGANGNLIGPANILSRNTWAGVHFEGASHHNNVLNNAIGTNGLGTVAYGNYQSGVAIAYGSHDNFISGNFTSGNGWCGIQITGVSTDHNIVRGNRVGVNAAGTAAMANLQHGMAIAEGASHNIVDSQNIMSGNGWSGVGIYGNTASSRSNTIAANAIGVGADQATAIPNAQNGVKLYLGAADNNIGPGNIISGNLSDGLLVTDALTTNNSVFQNTIGANAAGSGAVANGGSGIRIDHDANNTHVGPDNVIVAAGDHGVAIGGGAHDNSVYNSYVGVNRALEGQLGNTGDGVSVAGPAHANTIESNVIANNEGAGVRFSGADCVANACARNVIGAGQPSMYARGNRGPGVAIMDGANANSVTDNTIGANWEEGVEVCGSGTYDNVVDGNRIGIASDGVGEIGNESDGVRVCDGARANEFSFNIISDNDGFGIRIDAALETLVADNIIGLSADKATAVGNGAGGIQIANGGAVTRVTANHIGGNYGDGVQLRDAGTTNNRILENVIGVKVAENLGAPNRGCGVHVGIGAAENHIGVDGDALTSPAGGNEIVMNTSLGILVDRDAGRTVFRFNVIRSNGRITNRQVAVLREGLQLYPPWFVGQSGGWAHGLCVAEDVSIIDVYASDVDYAFGEYVGARGLIDRSYDIAFAGDWRHLKATVTTAQGTSEIGWLRPKVYYSYRNSVPPDFIPGFLDHVGITVDFQPYGELGRTAVVVEAVPFDGVRRESWPDFVAAAEIDPGTSRPEIVSVEMSDQAIVDGILDWIWWNPFYLENTPIGHAGYSIIPGAEKGEYGDYSCVGLTERAAEAAGFDITPSLNEHFPAAPSYDGFIIFVPSMQLNFLSSGIVTLPNAKAGDASSAEVAFVRLSGHALPYYGSNDVPFAEARCRLSAIGLGPVAGSYDGVSITCTADGLLGGAVSVPGDQRVALSFDSLLGRWVAPLPLQAAGSPLIIDLFLTDELDAASVGVDFTSGGAVIPGETIAADVSYTHIGSPLTAFDYNLDGVVDSLDAAYFQACFATPSADCRYYFDADLDNDVDCADWSGLKAAWSDESTLPPVFGPCDVSSVSDEDDATGRPSPRGVVIGMRNPYHAGGDIEVQLTKSGLVLQVDIYDVAGRHVRTLYAGASDGDRISLVWSGRDEFGRVWPSGVYVMNIKAGGKSLARKFLLVR